MSTEAIPFEDLGNEEEGLPIEIQPPPGLQHTSKLGELVKALAAARKQFKRIVKDSENPYFKSKYADLATVIEATAEALSDHNLVIIQSTRVSDHGKAIVTTKLCHGSGQWIQDELALPMVKFDAQGAGSAFTYARRYALSAFLNVAADADDDANAAVGPRELPKPPAKKTAPISKPPVEDAAPTFAKLFWAKAKAAGKTETVVREYVGYLGYESTTEIPPAKQSEALKWADGTL